MAMRNLQSVNKEAFRRLFVVDSGPVTLKQRGFSNDLRGSSSAQNCLGWKKFAQGVYTHMTQRLETLSGIFGRQCNAIVAQRLRRAVQIITHYHKLGYDQEAIKKFVDKIRRGIIQRNRPLYALVGAAAFQWDQEGIDNNELAEVASDMNYIDSSKPEQRQSEKGVVTVREDMLDGWEKVIDREHFKLWRKPIPDSYLYQYKVFGTYNDLPARAFFNAQIDTEFRKQWDRLVIKLDVIDRNDDTGDEVVHWVMHFPYPMYSREYVYIRNTMVDYNRKLMVIINRSVEHPSCPMQKQYVRVNTYVSNMVIKPHSTFDEDGFDYVLTYYDEPKAAIPTPAYNWMAKTGVPDFVDKVHDAAKKLYEQTHGVEPKNACDQRPIAI